MRKVFLLFVLAGLAVPVIAVAQSNTASSPAHQAGGKTGMTLVQFQARHDRKVMAADTDGDGRVSKTEFLAAAKTGKGDPARRFAKLDRNGDGYVDKSEVDAMLARRFRKIDTNGDGVASPQERAAAKSAKAGKAGKAAAAKGDQDS